MVKEINIPNLPSCTYQVVGNEQEHVLLIHGFGEDIRIWKYQIDALSKKFTCILPDLPGCGSSAGTDHVMSIEHLATLMEAILQAEKIEKIHLMGHSMGGYIAMAFAALYPHKLFSLGLIHSSAAADSEEKKENRKKSIQLIAKEGGKETFLKAMIPNLYAPKFKVTHQDELSWHLSLAMQQEEKTLIGYYQAMIERPSRTDTLKNLPCPLLLIAGKVDNAVAFQDSLAQAAMAPVCKVILWDDVGHMGMLENKEEMSSTILSFLAFVSNTN